MGNVAVDVLLGVAVAAELLCALGVAVMRTTFDRLHYVGAASTVGPLLVLAALIVREHLSSQALEGIAAIGILCLASPIVVHALARAARRIEYGAVTALPEERIPGGERRG
ncbi:MAG TPA: monovalent cation/H(+) antiporter subunit G [Gaiellaceae bacterium]|nr:monovalent cation/H(+) antiporter subunit G [Gaiellaceae bacterium]